MSWNHLPLLQFTLSRRPKLIRQTESAECGLACLAMVAGWQGPDTDMTILRRRFSVSVKGATSIATAATLSLTISALSFQHLPTT